MAYFQSLYDTHFQRLESKIGFNHTNLIDEINNLEVLIWKSEGTNAPLRQCSELSILNVLETVCIYGLTLNQQSQECFIDAKFMPEQRGFEARLVIGYRGYIKIATLFNVIKAATATLVYESDHFTSHGPNEEIEHNITTLSINPQVRGKCVGGYCRALLPDGGVLNSFISIEELDSIAHGQIEATLGNTPWNSIWATEMRRIAVYRRAGKEWMQKLCSTHELNNTAYIL